MSFRSVLSLSVLLAWTVSSKAQINCPPQLPVTLAGNTSYCIGTPGAELHISEVYTQYEWLPTSLVTQSVLLTAGNYEVVVTHYTGCTDTISFEVEQVSNPPQPVIVADGPVTLCEGESVTLAGPEGYPYYLWNTGSVGQQVTVFESGTYVVSVVDEIGCSSSSSSVQVAVGPLPEAAFSANLDGYEVVFQNFSLDALSYEWNLGDGTFVTDFEPVYTYGSDGPQSGWLVASNDCGNDTAFFHFQGVGINESARITAVGLSPNPVVKGDPFHLVLRSEITGSGSVQLIDGLGRIVMEDQMAVKVGENRLSMESSGLSSGLYFAQLCVNSSITRAMLVVD